MMRNGSSSRPCSPCGSRLTRISRYLCWTITPAIARSRGCWSLQRSHPCRCGCGKPSANLGVTAGLNMLLGHAKGRFVAILDHDDLWHRDKTRLQVDFLEKYPDVPGCGAQTYVWWERTGRVSRWKARERDSHTFHLTLMFRNRRDWRYDESLVFRADGHFTKYVLCAEGRQLYNFQRPLAVWRMRADRSNLSRRWHSVKLLWSYWHRTHEHIETLKGIFARLLPNEVLDYLLCARHSISELRVGDAALDGFPPPVGPHFSPGNGQA